MKEINLIERFKRQTCLREVGPQGQEKLLSSKVLVVGVGGLGSPVIRHLAMMGVGHIGVCDDDVVDITNLHRQGLYEEDEVGQKKVHVAQNKAKRLFSQCQVEVYDQKLDASSAQEILKGYDIIVDCTDNFKAKFLLHDACYLLKKDLVQSSIYQFEGHVHTFKFSDVKNRTESPCLRCLWPEVIDESCTGSCAEVGVLGVVPGIFGSFQALETVKLILGLETLNQGESYTLDLLNFFSFRHSWKKNSDCVLCSNHAPIDSLNRANYAERKEVFELSKRDLESGNFLCFDIRTPEEMENSPLLNLMGMPVYSWGQEKEIQNDKKYVFICEKGIRSKKLVENLRKRKLENCYSLYGGISS